MMAANTPSAAPPVLAPSASAVAADAGLGRPATDVDPGCARARPYELPLRTAAPEAASTAATSLVSKLAANAAAIQPTCARALPYSAVRLTTPSSCEAPMSAASRGMKLPAIHASASDPPQLAHASGHNGLPTAATDGSPALFSPAQTGPGPSDQGFTAQTRADQQRSGLLQVSQAACANQQAGKQGNADSIHGSATAVISSSDATGQQAARELVAEDDGPSQNAIQVRQSCCGCLPGGPCRRLVACDDLEALCAAASADRDQLSLLLSSADAGAQAAASSVASA